MDQLRGQHCLVTGAGGALGQAVCTTLLASGMHVTAADQRRTALDTLRADMAHHERLSVAEADVLSTSHLDTLFDAVEHGTGPLDAVVHCVGAWSGGAFADHDDDTLARMLSLNFVSGARVLRAALTRMTPRGRGRIVMVCGLAAEAPSPGAAVYGATKAALAHLVQSTAREASMHHITVNAVMPGMMDTPANRAAMPDADVTRWVPTLTVAKAIAALLAAGGDGVTGTLVRIPDSLST
jgi:NAD(P)-dependent dehydrogenase (short-subunit alcohol dehydrogenase family)